MMPVSGQADPLLCPHPGTQQRSGSVTVFQSAGVGAAARHPHSTLPTAPTRRPPTAPPTPRGTPHSGTPAEAAGSEPALRRPGLRLPRPESASWRFPLPSVGEAWSRGGPQLQGRLGNVLAGL